MKNRSYSHFRNEETEVEKLTNVLKIAKLVSEKEIISM